jgi:hypothetical protein
MLRQAAMDDLTPELIARAAHAAAFAAALRSLPP